jgi:WD40 repeat protein
MCLPNNDIACTIFLNKPVSIVIYHSNYNYQSFKLLADPREPYMSITGLSGNHCAILTISNHVHIYDDITKDNPKCIKKIHTFQSLLFVPKSNLLLAANTLDRILVLNPNDEFNCVCKIDTEHTVYCFALLSGGFFATGGIREIKIWDLKTYKCIKSMNKWYSVNSLLLMEDCRLVFTYHKSVSVLNYE